ncbi:hypothetical protein IGJ02_000375 [Enterococcus sp. DIV0724b]|uniref:ABC transporter permease n=1 Tax=Enterococcus sp. DIV0724b TaxID=2774694 RepID=UPI003D2FA2A1
MKRAFPKSFFLQKLFNSIIGIFIPIFIYKYVFFEHLSTQFTTYSKTSDYIIYISLGHLANIISFSTLLNVGRCIISEIREGTIDVFVLSPASRIGYFLGVYTEQISRTFLEVLFVIVILLFLGINLVTPYILVIIMVLTCITSIASFSMAMMLASLMVFTRDTFITQNTLFFIMSIICGVSFPIEFLPQPVQFLSYLLPLTYSTKLFRNVLVLNSSLIQNWLLIVVMIVLGSIYFALGFAWYKKLEKKIIEDVFS